MSVEKHVKKSLARFFASGNEAGLLFFFSVIPTYHTKFTHTNEQKKTIYACQCCEKSSLMTLKVLLPPLQIIKSYEFRNAKTSYNLGQMKYIYKEIKQETPKCRRSKTVDPVA